MLWGSKLGSLKMGEHSEPKQVCRRNALAFLGYAAVFALVASPAILAVSQAEAQTTTAPATPTTPPTDAPKSGTERRQERRSGRTERRQERRTGTHRAASGTAHRARRTTGRARRHQHYNHRAKKVVGFIRADQGNRAASALAREDRTRVLEPGGQFISNQ